MKSKLIIVLSLLFVLNLEALVLAEKANTSAAFNPDGVSVTTQRRKRRRARRRQKARSYAIKVMPEPPPPPPPEPAPEAGSAPPAAQEAPTTSAPPPASDPMDSPGRGTAPKKGAPRIKPPTVQIKPPTR